MTQQQSRQSTLGCLRSVVPQRHVTYGEALRIAELQATKLAELLDPQDNGLGEVHLSALPRIAVTYESLPVSGMSHWNGHTWVISLSVHDSPARQRFTLLHEFKHIVDHGRADRLYTGNRNKTAAQQAESAADYFAGCSLVSKRRLKAAWGNGIQHIADLADHFCVSEAAMRVRLSQTGLDALTDVANRCARPIRTPPPQPQRFRLATAPYPTGRTE